MGLVWHFRFFFGGYNWILNCGDSEAIREQDGETMWVQPPINKNKMVLDVFLLGSQLASLYLRLSLEYVGKASKPSFWQYFKYRDFKKEFNQIWNRIFFITSSTAQGGGGSFKNRKPIGEIGCCESGMAERIHWWTERCLRSPLFLSLSLTIYLPTSLSSMYLSLSLFDLSICLAVYLSIYLSVCLPVYLWCSVIQCNVV